MDIILKYIEQATSNEELERLQKILEEVREIQVENSYLRETLQGIQSKLDELEQLLAGSSDLASDTSAAKRPGKSLPGFASDEIVHEVDLHEIEHQVLQNVAAGSDVARIAQEMDLAEHGIEASLIIIREFGYVEPGDEGDWSVTGSGLEYLSRNR